MDIDFQVMQINTQSNGVTEKKQNFRILLQELLY